MLPTLPELQSASEIVYRVLQPTPQLVWPLLSERCGCEVWVKHENHLPTGSFKVRGGLVYHDDLRQRRGVRGVVAATRGNHGQSVAFAARRNGLSATIVVPHGNSSTKNSAMKALGAALVEHGRDFQEAYERALLLAAEHGLHMVPSFHPLLVRGVGTYALEFFRAVTDCDAVYVPIGLGSGICGVLAARQALGIRTRVVGVVAERAPAYLLSFQSRRQVTTESSDTFADGVAVRVPDQDALDVILEHVDRIVAVSEQEMRQAVRHYFTDTHSVVEGAGAAALAGLLRERAHLAGRRVGVVLSGGNIDLPIYREILAS